MHENFSTPNSNIAEFLTPHDVVTKWGQVCCSTWNSSMVFQTIMDCSLSQTWQTAYEYLEWSAICILQLPLQLVPELPCDITLCQLLQEWTPNLYGIMNFHEQLCIWVCDLRGLSLSHTWIYVLISDQLHPSDGESRRNHGMLFARQNCSVHSSSPSGCVFPCKNL